MVSEDTLTIRVTVTNELGLHARPAAKLVHIANNFKAALRVRKPDVPGKVGEADCRSVLSLLMLAAAKGTELDIIAAGEDAESAANAIANYFKSNFEE